MQIREASVEANRNAISRARLAAILVSVAACALPRPDAVNTQDGGATAGDAGPDAGAGDAGGDGGGSITDAGEDDAGPTDAGSDDAGSGTCVGTRPVCCGLNAQGCNAEMGHAHCVGDTWTCPNGEMPGSTCASFCVVSDGGIADAGAGDAGAGDVDGGAAGCAPACNSNEVCVSDQTVGGGEPFPDDAGNCPAGTVHAGDRCALPPTYACGSRPAGCGTTLDCSCAGSLCTGNYMCSSTGTDLVNCVFDAP